MKKITILVATQSVQKDNFLNGISQDDLYIRYPESGKHPLEQRDLADELTKNYKDIENNIIIDTFSDHILNRIRKLICDSIIDHNDIEVIYIYDNVLTKVTINRCGEYTKPFPKGFYNATLEDIYELKRDC